MFIATTGIARLVATRSRGHVSCFQPPMGSGQKSLRRLSVSRTSKRLGNLFPSHVYVRALKSRVDRTSRKPIHRKSSQTVIQKTNEHCDKWVKFPSFTARRSVRL